MSDPDQQPYALEKWTEMVEGALGAHGIEQALRGVIERATGNGTRPTLIASPGGPPIRLNVPSAQDLGLMNVNAAIVALQTARITLLLINDLDSRLRLLQGENVDRGAAQSVPCAPSSLAT